MNNKNLIMNYYLLLGVDFSFVLCNIQISFFFQKILCQFQKTRTLLPTVNGMKFLKGQGDLEVVWKYVIRTNISLVRANLTSKHFFWPIWGRDNAFWKGCMYYYKSWYDAYWSANLGTCQLILHQFGRQIRMGPS